MSTQLRATFRGTLIVALGQGPRPSQGPRLYLLALASHRFRDMATYSLKISTENWRQTAADRDMVTIDSL